MHELTKLQARMAREGTALSELDISADIAHQPVRMLGRPRGAKDSRPRSRRTREELGEIKACRSIQKLRVAQRQVGSAEHRSQLATFSGVLHDVEGFAPSGCGRMAGLSVTANYEDGGDANLQLNAAIEVTCSLYPAIQRQTCTCQRNINL